MAARASPASDFGRWSWSRGHQEINYYQNGSVVAKTGKWKTRRIHTLKIETAQSTLARFLG